MMIKVLAFIVAFVLLHPAVAQDETIHIDFPPPIYDLAGQVTISGTVDPPDLQSYYLEQAPFYLQNPDAEVYWVPASLPSPAPVVDGVLATWDTTALPEGRNILLDQFVLAVGATALAFLTLTGLGLVERKIREKHDES